MHYTLRIAKQGYFMKIKYVIYCLWMVAQIVGTTSPLYAQAPPPLMTVDELRPGMKGVGKTVFSGINIEEFDVEILAAPTDLLFMCNGEYGITHMLTKKNEFGETKLRLKKGGRNAAKLLFVQNLLSFK